MAEAAKYRKRALVIEAMRWNSADPAAVGEMVGWLIAAGCDFHHPTGVGSTTTLAIRTLEGEMTTQPGDWIIRGVQGEFYPCKPDIFEATYEPVSSA